MHPKKIDIHKQYFNIYRLLLYTTFCNIIVIEFMQRKYLFIFTLIISLLGLLSIIFLAEFSEFEKVNIDELESQIDQRIIIQGKLVKIQQKSNVNFFEVEDQTGVIDVVAFGNMPYISKNNYVQIDGKVVIYKGELEIIADKIKLL